MRRAGLDGLWFWFRDHWGVVWALRNQERFNRTAELAGWPVRLTWYGLAPVDGPGEGCGLVVPAEAEPAFRGLSQTVRTGRAARSGQCVGRQRGQPLTRVAEESFTE